MRFGTKKSESKASSSGDFLPYLRNFRDGDNEVRFLDEIGDFIVFKEHYASGKSFPCTQDRNTCPGCKSDVPEEAKSSLRYAANVLLIENQMALPFRLPVSLVKQLETRAERYETIRDRDYIVVREGKGFNTTYDLDSSEKYKMDFSEHETFDIEGILTDTFADVWGIDPNDLGDEDTPEVKEDVVEESSDSSEISEEELMGMTRVKLLRFAKENDVKVDSTAKKEDILDAIMESA